MTVQPEFEHDGSIKLTILVQTLDRSNAADLRETAARVITAATPRMEVDCSRLDFIDSSGLGALIHTHNLLAESQRPVRLTGVGPKMLALLEFMQVHRIFELEPATSPPQRQ